MKIQNLAIIFIIIILPIAMVLTAYIQTQIDTIALQTQYNNKLQTATADAIKAFQLNTINNKYSTLSDSKIRDIEASISTFYNSLGTELGASGYSKEELQDYIPAILYTMYDGYYINSKFYNSSLRVADVENGEEIYGGYQYGLKPYIYYACRYKKGSNYDFIVNYTLDNNITIYGIVDGEYVTKSGALINPRLIGGAEEGLKDIETLVQNGDISRRQYSYIESYNRYTQEYATEITYDGIKFEREVLKEQLVLLNNNNTLVNENNPIEYEYTVCKGSRIYKENGSDKFFRVNNKNQKEYVYDPEKEYITDPEILAFIDNIAYYDGHLHSNSSVQYFYDAYKFSKWVTEKLGSITQENAYDIDGKTKITDFAINTGDEKIFDLTAKSSNKFINNPLLSTSTFNQNRVAVIRKSIETNLASAIANFSSGKGYEYVMPVFSEEDWDKLVNNISVSTFMQGIPIGAKYYNNYCIITNDKNKEVVTTDSIYVIQGTGTALSGEIEEEEAHFPTCREVIKEKIPIVQAYRNVDFERQTVVINEGNERYYYPHSNERSYNCMIGIAQTYNLDDLIQGKMRKESVDLEKEILDNGDIDNTLTNNILENNLRRVYLTALTREKYDLYKTNAYFSDNKTLSTGNITIYGMKGYVDPYWKNENKTVDLPIQPGLTLQYQVNGGEWISVDPNDPNIREGKYTTPKYPSDTKIAYKYVDGNSSSNDQTINVTKIDKTAPTIEGISLVRKGINYFTVTVTARDNESGIANIKWYYRKKGTANWNLFDTATFASINGVATGNQVATAQASKYGLEQGEYEVYAEATDTAGNGPVKTDVLTVTLDSGVIGGDGTNVIRATVIPTKWTNTDVSVILSTRPNYTTIYQMNNINGDWSTYSNTIKIGENNTTVYYAYYDGLNMISRGSATINNIDKFQPEITRNIGVDSIKSNQVSLSMGVQDKQSGLDKVNWYYKKVGDENYSILESTIPVPLNKIGNVMGEGDTDDNKIVTSTISNLSKGSYKIYAEVYDKAGNKKSTLDDGGEELTISIGEVPEATDGDAEANPTYWTNQNVIVTVRNKEGYTVQYQKNRADGYWDTYYENIIQTSNGTVYYRYTDGVNTNNYGSITVNNIDKKAPTITSIETSDITSNSFKVKVKATDSDSGISKIVWKYKLTGKKEQVYPENEFMPINSYEKGYVNAEIERTFDSLVRGLYSIEAEVYDVAGNKTSSQKVYLTIEGIGDESGEAIVTPEYWTNGNVTVELPILGNFGTEYQENSVSGEWNFYENVLTITKNETIYYRFTDGINVNKESSVNITNIDKVNPRIVENIKLTDVGTNFAKLKVKVQDSDSGIGKAVWYYREKAETEYTTKEVVYVPINSTMNGERVEKECIGTIDGLESGKEYEIYAEIYDVAGNKVRSEVSSNVKPVVLPEVPVILANINPKIWTNQQVKVSFENLEEREDYFVEYLTPETEGAWENLDDHSTDFIEMNENGTIYLRYSDGLNGGKAVTLNIINIDKTNPIVNKDIEVSLTNAIDLTGLATGAAGSHTHIFRSTYNDTYHWEECVICKANGINTIQNKHTHTKIETGWVNSDRPHCQRGNYKTQLCKDGCGWSKKVTEPHTLDGNIVNVDIRYNHHESCSVCGDWTYNSAWINGANCVDNRGVTINCDYLENLPNGGKVKCAICQHEYKKEDMVHHVYARTLSILWKRVC